MVVLCNVMYESRVMRKHEKWCHMSNCWAACEERVAESIE